MAPGELQDYLDNEPERARRCAFERERFEHLGCRVDAAVAFRVETELRVEPDCGYRSAVRIELVDRIDVRLDRLLASQLAISRSRLARDISEGHVVVPEARRALRRPARHGQWFEVLQAVQGG